MSDVKYAFRQIAQLPSRGTTIHRRKESPQNNASAVQTTNRLISPTQSDDETQGFGDGDLWNNTALGLAFVLISAAAGAAIWQYTAERNPLGTDNAAAGYNQHHYWLNSTTGVVWRCDSILLGVAVWVELNI